MSGPAAALIPSGVDGALVLVRHGQSTFVAEHRFQGRLDPPLSALGEAQARLAGESLARPGGPPGLGLHGLPREIAHSPLIRVARSAELIAEALSVTSAADLRSRLRADPQLQEIGQGAWEGLTSQEVEARWGDVSAAWRRDATSAWAPGGESPFDADARVRASLPAILQTLHGSGTDSAPWSIVVAHGGVLRLLLLALLDLPVNRFWTFPFAVAGISVIDMRDGQASLRTHNLVEHLAPLAGDASGTPTAAGDSGGRETAF